MPDHIKGFLHVDKNGNCSTHIMLFEPSGDLFCEAEKLLNCGFVAVEAILEGVEELMPQYVVSK
jgi:hypothetical protein